MNGEVVRFPGPDEVAQRVADDVTRLVSEAQRSRPVASLVLTGGTISRKVHGLVPAASDGLVDWGRVDVWWGDERYVPADDSERNAGQAWHDMLNALPVPPARVHEMAASDAGQDPGAAATAYAAELRRAVEARHEETWFDVLMLGIGPDGHCASLFPGRDEVHSSDDVLAVHDSPKPPPTRITLGMQVLLRARHVLFVATGDEKAEAVAASVRGGDVERTPSAGPRGSVSTTWYVDDAAATSLRPGGLRR